MASTYEENFVQNIMNILGKNRQEITYEVTCDVRELTGFGGSLLFSTCPLEMAISHWSFLSYLSVPRSDVFDKQDERRRSCSTYGVTKIDFYCEGFSFLL